ncbi:MAG TPA: anti-sigma factor, partial [Gemmatimonadales bacterium]|nr:anti-sigma factor [Gemmatimonadales bacterium]
MNENPDKEALAAEYVLGTLNADERGQAQRMMSSDPGFAATVRAWERRLGELNVLVAPVEPPPHILERIKARMSGAEPLAEVPVLDPAALAAAAPDAAAPDEVAPASVAPTIEPPAVPVPASAPPPSGAEVIDLTRRFKRWRGIAAATAALAAAFAGLVVIREVKPELMPDPLKPRVIERTVEVIKEVPSPKPAQYVAVLQRDAASPAFLLTFDLDRRTLTVRTVGAERQTGKSYELWLVSDRFAAPRSLGLIGSEEFTQRPQLANYDAVTINRATYAVSLEPEGGSPTGQPTGPVLYSGKLLQATPPSFDAPSP